jgi:pimeloyl-ACP methyl ester carboxylesterase
MPKNREIEEKSSIELEGSRLFYQKQGHGPLIFLAFHGFAQHSGYFAQLVKPLAETHTFFCFDLFFHKQSHWAHGLEALQPAHWKEIMEAFLLKENIPNFGLTAFSLGGRFAMLTLELFPERVEKMVLLSPDGIKTNPWYNLGTNPLMRSVFTGILKHPGPFLFLNHWAGKLGILPKKVAAFNHSQLSVRHRRKRVILTWLVFKPIKPRLKILASSIKKNKIPVHFLLGRFDPVIHIGTVQPLLKLLPESRVTLLPTGHYDLMDKTNPITLKNLYS